MKKYEPFNHGGMNHGGLHEYIANRLIDKWGWIGTDVRMFLRRHLRESCVNLVGYEEI